MFQLATGRDPLVPRLVRRSAASLLVWFACRLTWLPSRVADVPVNGKVEPRGFPCAFPYDVQSLVVGVGRLSLDLVAFLCGESGRGPR